MKATNELMKSEVKKVEKWAVKEYDSKKATMTGWYTNGQVSNWNTQDFECEVVLANDNVITVSFTVFLDDRRKSYVVNDCYVEHPKKSTRRKTFCKTEIKNYFGMDVDDCGGLFKGYVYLEIRGKNFKLYRLKKGYDGMEDSEFAWEVICETTDKNEVMKHLMVYGDYETYNWWKPFDCSSSWSLLNNVVADYALA